MFEAFRFWLRKGVDGFRVDVMWLMIKDDQFRDNPPNPGYTVWPGVARSIVAGLQLGPARSARAGGRDAGCGGGISGSRADWGNLSAGSAADDVLRAGTARRQSAVQFPVAAVCLERRGTGTDHRDYMSALPAGAWPNWVLGNHDKSRIASRIGLKKARAAALLLLSLPGTLTMYYGEELGMQDVPIPPDEAQDPAEKTEPGIGMGRDPERTPMPWDNSRSMRIHQGKPWLPIGDANRAVNVDWSRNGSGFDACSLSATASAAASGAGACCGSAYGDGRQRWSASIRQGGWKEAVQGHY